MIAISILLLAVLLILAGGLIAVFLGQSVNTKCLADLQSTLEEFCKSNKEQIRATPVEPLKFSAPPAVKLPIGDRITDTRCPACQASSFPYYLEDRPCRVRFGAHSCMLSAGHSDHHQSTIHKVAWTGISTLESVCWPSLN